MIIWFAALIPFIGASALYWIWNRKVCIWEAGVMMAVPILLIAGAKICSERSQTQDTEYWGGYVTSAAFFEDWNEEVSCRHPISCSHPEYSTDSKGRLYQSGYKHSNDGYYHAYDVDNHPEYWEVYTSLQETKEIGRGWYDNLCVQFGNRAFVNLHRSYHTKNGNKYVTTWNGEAEKLEPVTVAHTYENRIQASNSVFNFKTVDPAEHNLFQYPSVNGLSQQCTMGPGTTAPVEKKFQYLNATLGSSRQVRLYVLVFQNQTMQAAMDQEAFWKRGNKNEFVTCVGVNNDLEIQWAYAFSWTDVEELKILARDQIMSMKKLDLLAYANWLGPVIEAKWKRKNFEDFNYITVEPTTSAVIWTFVLTFAVTVGIGVWAVLNQFEPERGFGMRRTLG